MSYYYSTSTWLNEAAHAIADLVNSYDFQSEQEARMSLDEALYELSKRKLYHLVDEAIEIRKKRIHRDATAPIVLSNKWGKEYLSKKSGYTWYDHYHKELREGRLPF